jgi:2-aminoethylphosphonate-pyruvate transaminase
MTEGRRLRLLNPGPVTMTERVRRALASEDVCHREPEFRDLVASVRTRLRDIYGEPDYTPVLLGGSGTAAVETMLSLVGRDETALVVANGVYGERMAAMLDAQGKAHEVVRSAWTSGIDLEEVDRALATGRFQRILAVHHETTTGRLNDVGALGLLAHAHGAPILLDAVSSFAGEEIRLAEWNVEALAATANKCVHGAPGVSFVLAQNAAMTRAPSNGGATSVYLDLARHAHDQARGSTPFTLPTHVTRAFDEALAELEEEGGWRTRHATYAERSKHVRAVCAELHARPLLEGDAAYSSMLTSFRLPPGVTYEELHAELKRDGFVIYAGQGKFEGDIFRIAVMGALSADDLEELARSLRRALGEKTRVPTRTSWTSESRGAA